MGCPRTLERTRASPRCRGISPIPRSKFRWRRITPWPDRPRYAAGGDGATRRTDFRTKGHSRRSDRRWRLGGLHRLFDRVADCEDAVEAGDLEDLREITVR